VESAGEVQGCITKGCVCAAAAFLHGAASLQTLSDPG